MGLVLIGSVASAAEISFDTASGPGTALVPTARDDYALTQNASTYLVAGIYTCGNVALGYTLEGWALRRFSLTYEFGIEAPFWVTSVDWGVRRYCALLDSVPEGPYIVHVGLYSIDETDPLLFENMTLIESVPVEIAYLADEPIAPVAYNTFFDSTFDPNGRDLVVAIHYPEGYSTTPATRFSPAGNSLGETLPGYVAFADCGYPEPVTPGDLGNTTPMVVMVVNGNLGPPPPQVTGACCDEAESRCVITTQADCIFDWLGPDVPCNYVTCPLCCPPPPSGGACCNPVTGDCVVTMHADCEFEWLDGAPCNLQTCPIPVPIERKSWGALKNLYRDATSASRKPECLR
jgi:hypothetical protein